MSDRKALIRIASSLPKGSEGRRVLLAELQKESANRAYKGSRLLWDNLSADGKGGGKVDRRWLSNPGSAGIAGDNKYDAALYAPNPAPIEKWQISGEPWRGAESRFFGLDGETAAEIWWIMDGDFTRIREGGVDKVWSGKGRVTMYVRIWSVHHNRIENEGEKTKFSNTAKFSFTNGKVKALESAFNKVVKQNKREALALEAHLQATTEPGRHSVKYQDKPERWELIEVVNKYYKSITNWRPTISRQGNAVMWKSHITIGDYAQLSHGKHGKVTGGDYDTLIIDDKPLKKLLQGVGWAKYIRSYMIRADGNQDEHPDLDEAEFRVILHFKSSSDAPEI